MPSAAHTALGASEALADYAEAAYRATYGHSTSTPRPDAVALTDKAAGRAVFASRDAWARAAPTEKECRARLSSLVSDSKRLGMIGDTPVRASLASAAVASRPQADESPPLISDPLPDTATDTQAHGSQANAAEIDAAHPEWSEDVIADSIAENRRQEQEIEAAQTLPPRTSEPQRTSGRVLLTKLASTVQMRNVRWVWPGYIPTSKLTIITGMPGELKSAVSLDVLARITRGDVMPDESDSCFDGPRAVLVVTQEDDPEDTIVPRFEAMGGDRSLLHIIDYGLSICSQWKDLRATIDVHAIAVVAFDPLEEYSGAANSISGRDVRQALNPFVHVLRETGTAGIGIMHLNKNESNANPLNRLTDSRAYGALSRAVFLTGRLEGERRAMMRVKGNLSMQPPTLAYRPETKYVRGETGPVKTLRIVWEEAPCEVSVSQLLETTGLALGARETAAETLRLWLADGPLPVREIEQRVEQETFSMRTLRRAANELGIVTGSLPGEKQGPSYWRFPSEGDAAS